MSEPSASPNIPKAQDQLFNQRQSARQKYVSLVVGRPDLATLGELAERVSNVVRGIPGTLSSYPERAVGGYALDFDVDRVEAARYGLTTGDVQDVVQTAIGGMNVTWTVEGRERYPLNIRYARELRDDLPALQAVLVFVTA